MQSVLRCSRALTFASTFLMLVSTCSSFGVFAPSIKSNAHNNFAPSPNDKFMLYMTMTTVEKIMTIDETFERNLGKSKGSNTLEMTSDRNEIQDTEDQNEGPQNVDEDTERQQVNREKSTSGDIESDDDMERRRKELVMAGLLGKGGAPSRSKEQSKATSVGARRVGSATKARQGALATSRVMDSLRKTAGAKSNSKTDAPPNEGENRDGASLSFVSSVQSLTRSAIMTAVEEALLDRKPKVNETPLVKSNLTAAHFTHEYERPMGLVLDNQENESQAAAHDFPGTIVLSPSPNDSLLIRIATPIDDHQIATLRLSVFSDFSPEQQGKFCERSCQAISSRRLRGACCLIAAQENDAEKVLGSAECSYHEFFGTRLGQRRPQFSILYVTEVAVNADVRGQGIGKKLMDAVEFYATSRGVETIYLHVDVDNKAARALYEKAGYKCVNGEEDPMYLEFTTSLNLHPGATKGRNHYLMFKNLVSEPVWFEPKESKVHEEVKVTGTLGFDISV